MSTYFFDGLSNGELLTFKTGPPCIKRTTKDQDIRKTATNYSREIDAALTSKSEVEALFGLRTSRRICSS